MFLKCYDKINNMKLVNINQIQQMYIESNIDEFKIMYTLVGDPKLEFILTILKTNKEANDFITNFFNFLYNIDSHSSTPHTPYVCIEQFLNK